VGRTWGGVYRRLINEERGVIWASKTTSKYGKFSKTEQKRSIFVGVFVWLLVGGFFGGFFGGVGGGGWGGFFIFWRVLVFFLGGVGWSLRWCVS